MQVCLVYIERVYISLSDLGDAEFGVPGRVKPCLDANNSQGFIQVFWEGAFFAKIGKESGHLGIKIAGVSCKIREFCMILKK